MCEIKLATDWSSVFAGSEKRRGHAGCISAEADSWKALKKTKFFFFFGQSILVANSPTAGK